MAYLDLRIQVNGIPLEDYDTDCFEEKLEAALKAAFPICRFETEVEDQDDEDQDK